MPHFLADPAQVGSYLVGLLAALIVGLPKLGGALAEWRRQRAYREQGPVDPKLPPAPPVTAPVPTASAELIVLSERLRAVERDQDLARLRLKYESSLEERQELRIEVEALQNALTTERAENALLRARVEQLERELTGVLVQPDDGPTWPPGRP